MLRNFPVKFINQATAQLKAHSKDITGGDTTATDTFQNQGTSNDKLWWYVEH